MIILGNYVKDKITGFKGIVTARAEYLTGCIQFLVASEEGMPGDGKWFDKARITIGSADIFDLRKKTAEAPAGPQNSPKRTTPPC